MRSLTALMGHLAVALALLLPTACTMAVAPDGGTLGYARWLTMTDSTATVLNPWRPGEALHRYSLPAEGAAYRRVVSATSLHAYLAYRLGAADRMVGVMDAGYVVAPALRDALADGRLADFGSSMTPDIERLRAADCDLLFASPFENAGYGALATLGVPIVECADYMETSPLGRAEWMRFYGRLLGRGAEADSLFAAEVEAYDRAKAHAAGPDAHGVHAAGPTLLVGLRQGQEWSVPASGSYMARLFADAGFDYLFADIDGAGSVALDIESVYAKARDASVWIITGSGPLSYDALARQDERYREFRAFRERRIWYCNTLAVPYYDALPWQPATLLQELAAIADDNENEDENDNDNDNDNENVLRYFHPLP